MGIINRLPCGGGKEKHYAIIRCFTPDFMGEIVRCECPDVKYSKTATFSEDGECFFTVNDFGLYTLTCGEKSASILVGEWYKTYEVKLFAFNFVTWADGSWEDIAAMLDAHYKGYIDIADYWAVGDRRSVTFDIPSNSTGMIPNCKYYYSNVAYYYANTTDLIIIGIKHDDLADGSNKAAITVHSSLSLASVEDWNQGGPGDKDYDWDYAISNQWLKNVFEPAMPTKLASLVKAVSKKVISPLSSANPETIVKTYTMKTFTPGYSEITGVGFSKNLETTSERTLFDGEQYEYFKVEANLLKNQVWNGFGAFRDWWARDGFYYKAVSALRRYRVSNTTCMQIGYPGDSNNSLFGGVAPTFCL